MGNWPQVGPKMGVCFSATPFFIFWARGNCPWAGSSRLITICNGICYRNTNKTLSLRDNSFFNGCIKQEQHIWCVILWTHRMCCAVVIILKKAVITMLLIYIIFRMFRTTLQQPSTTKQFTLNNVHLVSTLEYRKIVLWILY
jgi:hypothetical protein